MVPYEYVLSKRNAETREKALIYITEKFPQYTQFDIKDKETAWIINMSKPQDVVKLRIVYDSGDSKEVESYLNRQLPELTWKVKYNAYREFYCIGIRKTIDPSTDPHQNQQGGTHYKIKPVQPWDVIDAYNLDFYVGNVVKYSMRHQEKGKAEDLQKAGHYIQKALKKLYGVTSIFKVTDDASGEKS